MARFDHDLIVIGGGAAALTMASGAAHLGACTLLLEQDEALGGGFFSGPRDVKFCRVGGAHIPWIKTSMISSDHDFGIHGYTLRLIVPHRAVLL